MKDLPNLTVFTGTSYGFYYFGNVILKSKYSKNSLKIDVSIYEEYAISFPTNSFIYICNISAESKYIIHNINNRF